MPHKSSRTSLYFLAAALIIACGAQRDLLPRNLAREHAYKASHSGAGHLAVEVLTPEEEVLARVERRFDIAPGKASFQEDLKPAKTIPVEDLVWHRVRYRFSYADETASAMEGTESISEILRTPVIHILGQQAYLAGGPAAVRVIATDSKNEPITGPSSVKIDLLADNRRPRVLFNGQLNRRGTAEAQFRFPAGLAGAFQLRYTVDTPIGSTEFTQQMRLQDKASILLTPAMLASTTHGALGSGTSSLKGGLRIVSARHSSGCLSARNSGSAC